MLGRAQHAAFAAAGGGTAGIAATGAAYVRFAVTHTALFRLIFATATATAPAGAAPDIAKKPADAIRFLLDNAAALTPAGMDSKVYALQAWAVAHGLAMLLIGGQINLDEATLDRVVECMPR